MKFCCEVVDNVLDNLINISDKVLHNKKADLKVWKNIMYIDSLKNPVENLDL